MNPYPANWSILVMDNCQIHYNIELVDIVNAAGMSPHLKLCPWGDDPLDSLGCLLIYLPPYLPDMNLIEESFSTCMHVSTSTLWSKNSYIPSKSVFTLAWPSNLRRWEPRDGTYRGLWVCNSGNSTRMVSSCRVHLEQPLIGNSFYYTWDTGHNNWMNNKSGVQVLEKTWATSKTWEQEWFLSGNKVQVQEKAWAMSETWEQEQFLSRNKVQVWEKRESLGNEQNMRTRRISSRIQAKTRTRMISKWEQDSWI